MTTANNRKGNNMKAKKEKLYKLYVNGEIDVMAFDPKVIAKRSNEIINMWTDAQKYGSSYWTDKPFPSFEVITNEVA